MTGDERRRLAESVQHNCHIADARGAADMTLCVYLLQMREFFRWERGLPFGAALARDDIGAWIADREALWQSLEGLDYRPLPVAGRIVEPFDAAAVNALLQPLGLVYGAGQVAAGRESFFLAELERTERRGEADLQVCGNELARNLAAPPATLQGTTIVLRRESLRRWLHEKYEAWTLKRQPGPFKAALDARGFERDGTLALERIAELDAETLVLHELGEFEAGRRLDPDWQALRSALASRRADLYVRAARDHLADCLVTLPALLRQRDAAALHFWFANLEGVREQLFPRLWPAYAAWCEGDDGAALEAAVAAGAEHWGRACERLLSLHRSRGSEAPALIERCVLAPEWTLA